MQISKYNCTTLECLEAKHELKQCFQTWASISTDLKNFDVFSPENTYITCLLLNIVCRCSDLG